MSPIPALIWPAWNVSRYGLGLSDPVCLHAGRPVLCGRRAWCYGAGRRRGWGSRGRPHGKLIHSCSSRPHPAPSAQLQTLLAARISYAPCPAHSVASQTVSLSCLASRTRIVARARSSENIVPYLLAHKNLVALFRKTGGDRVAETQNRPGLLFAVGQIATVAGIVHPHTVYHWLAGGRAGGQCPSQGASKRNSGHGADTHRGPTRLLPRVG